MRLAQQAVPMTTGPTPVQRRALGHPRPPGLGHLGAWYVVRIDVPPGMCFDWHREFCWELLVQGGEPVECGLDGVRFTAQPGDVLLVPPQMVHGTWNTGRRSCHQFVITFECNAVPLVEANPLFAVQPGQPLCRLAQEERAWFEETFHRLWWEQTTQRRDFEIAEESLLRLIFVGLARCRERSAPTATTNMHLHRDVMQYLDYVRAALDQPHPLQVAAQRLGASYESLRHRFRREVGVSPKQWLVKLRVDHAKHLLLSTSLPVKEIAAQVGYADVPQFTALFTCRVGLAPSQWRQRPTR